MTDTGTSDTTSRNWLIYIEAAIVVVFIILIFLHIRKGGATSPPPPLSQAQAFINQGDEYFANQDLARAIIEYWQAIDAIEGAKETSETSSDEWKALLLHAELRVVEIYSHSNWIEDARARLEHAAQIQPDHTELRLQRGKLLHDDGEKEFAVKELLAVIEKDPRHAEAHYLLGVLYHGARQYELAIKHYKKAVESDPNLVPLPFEDNPVGQLARLQLSRTYSRILQDYRFSDRELTDEDFEKMADMENQAIVVLEEAVDKNPDFTEAKGELIRLLYVRAAAIGREGETRQYDKALDVYQQIVSLDANEVDAFRQIGEINYAFLQDKEAALDAYRKAYQLDPDPGILAAIKNVEEELESERSESFE